jgi:hypothetical protein
VVFSRIKSALFLTIFALAVTPWARAQQSGAGAPDSSSPSTSAPALTAPGYTPQASETSPGAVLSRTGRGS